MIADPRLFVAVPLDEPARTAIVAAVETVRATPLEGRSVRWVRLDGLHLTLRFLGPTPADRIADVGEAVLEAAAHVPAFTLSLDGAGGFPSDGKPRTIWVGVRAGHEELAALAERVSEALERRGWAHDDRPFRAHLTLARSDGIRSGPATIAMLAEALGGQPIASRIDRVSVYESVTGRGPARYLAREVVPLR